MLLESNRLWPHQNIGRRTLAQFAPSAHTCQKWQHSRHQPRIHRLPWLMHLHLQGAIVSMSSYDLQPAHTGLRMHTCHEFMQIAHTHEHLDISKAAKPLIRGAPLLPKAAAAKSAAARALFDAAWERAAAARAAAAVKVPQMARSA